MSRRRVDRAVPDAIIEEAVTAVEASPPTPDHPEPDGMLAERLFTLQDLHAVRALVTGHAARFGLPEERASSFVLAVHEVAANSVQHGGGHGILRLWQDGDSLVCEVRDRGAIDPAQLEATLPSPEQTAGRGLWLARQLCDLVELRPGPTGTVVRLQVSAG